MTPLSLDRTSGKERVAEVTRNLARGLIPPGSSCGSGPNSRSCDVAVETVMRAGWPTATIDRDPCAIITWEVGAILGATS